MQIKLKLVLWLTINYKSALPDDRTWMIDDLSGFFKMVSNVQPCLTKASWPTTIGILFSENTRYHFPGLDRSSYMSSCEQITGQYLSSSLPVTYVNALDLGKKELGGYKALLLPRTAGLTADQLKVLIKYVSDGGTVISAGDAMLYHSNGAALKDFALADLMGVQLKAITNLTDIINTFATNWTYP